MRKGNFWSFDKARQHARSLNLKSVAGWTAYCKSGAKPDEIPNAPDQKYKFEWDSWGDWLGTGRVATQYKVYLPFEEARAFARTLGLKSQTEWRRYAKSDKKPENIPFKPERTYKQHWQGMGDWLGTFTVKTADRVYLSFDEARKFVHELHLNSSAEWKTYCQSGLKPANIPNSPSHVYHDEWMSVGDWLGTGTVASFLRKYLPFAEAREFARTLGLKTRRQWQDWCEENKPVDIPCNPHCVYEEFISYADWFGIDEYHERRAKERLEAESPLTNRQLEIIAGSLLGDATLTKIYTVSENSHSNSCFSVTHSEAQKGYIEWMHDELAPISKDITMRLSRPTVICGNPTPGGVPIYCVWTERHSVLTKMERKWYKRDAAGEYVYKVVNDKKYRIKVVPTDLVLTPLMVAIWFFDDGCIRTAGRNCWLYTMSFSWEECEFLTDQLKKLGITDCFPEYRRPTARLRTKQPVIHVGCRSFLDFVEMVKPHVPHVDLAYKIDISGYTEPEFTKMRSHERPYIIKMFEEGRSCTEIATQTGFSVSAVSLVLRDHTGKKESLNNTSGITGVRRQGTRWNAEIGLGEKCLHLGNYKDKYHAVCIRKEAEKLRRSGVVGVDDFYKLREKYAQFRDMPGRCKVS